MRNTWLNIYFFALFFFSTICSSSKSSIASIRDAWAGRKRRRKLKEIVGGGLAGRRQREDWSGHTRRVEEHPSWWRHLEGPISASTSVISSRFPHILPVVDWRFLPAVSLLPRRQLYTYLYITWCTWWGGCISPSELLSPPSAALLCPRESSSSFIQGAPPSWTYLVRVIQFPKRYFVIQ